MVANARRGLRRDKVAAGGIKEIQHCLGVERWRTGEIDRHPRRGHDLPESVSGDDVDAIYTRRHNDIVATLAQSR
jgi:hypothetical protein